MISYSGIAIFLFGNKIKDDEVVCSDGLIKEFEIAKSSGLLLLPVGATEYATREIHTTLLQEGYFDSAAFPDNARKYIDKLCDEKSNLATIKETLISLLRILE
jgi:hypothetical protein